MRWNGRDAVTRRMRLRKAEDRAACVQLAGAMMLAAMILVPGSSAAQTSDGTVRAETGRGSIEVAVGHHRGFGAVNAAQLIGGFLDDGIVRGPSVDGMLGGQPIRLAAGSPFIHYGDRTYQLANTPYQNAGTVWIPAELLTDWWPRIRQAANRGTPGALAGGVSADRSAATSIPAKRPSGPFRVIIDPGHGGKDPGTSGRSSREKDIVLAIGKALYRQLQDIPGIEPVLTRDRDVFIGLRDRSSRAVAEDGDLFVSIHANWFRDRRASGFETYFLSMARTDEARDVAVRENASAQYEEDASYADMGDLEFILAGLDRNENVLESHRIAGYVQNSLRGVRGTPDRGVKQAGFWVLVGASGSMPTILCEVGFLSNPDEERVLKSEAGQRQVAQSLARGIVAYRDYLDERWNRVVDESSSQR